MSPLFFDIILGVSKYRVHIIEKSVRSFKIIKTSQTLEERRSKPDYCNSYPNIKAIYTNSNKKLVAIAGAEILYSFIDAPKCDNKKNGSNSLDGTMADSQENLVYIEWK